MAEPVPRIAIFGTSRHLVGALASVEQRFPGAVLWLVTTPAALVHEGIATFPRERVVVYDRTPFFRLWPWLCSPAFWRLRRRRFDQAVVLYGNDEGIGHGHLRAIAVTVAGRSVLIHRPDQSLTRWHPCEGLVRGAVTLAVSGAAWLIIGTLILVPYWIVRAVRSLGFRRLEMRVRA